jgi:two-component system, chemotaxis family, CheB/CheR fusion protein
MLEIHGVGVGEDLLHLVRNVDPQSLRTIIDTTFNNEPSPPREILVVDPAGGEERWLHVSTAADRALAVRGGDTVALFIVDVSSSVGHRRELERTSGEQEKRMGELAARLDELGRRQRALLQANDQLTDANAELRSANEQLLISAEEAASANEEIETLNEEMQATNEELETLNEELQATVEELNTSNDELEARGDDLERLARTREEELVQVAAQRSAMASALETAAGPFVIVRSADEQAVYASEQLDGSVFVGLPDGWSRGDAVRLNGVTYETKRFSLDDLPYAVLTLRAKPRAGR